MRSSVVGYAHQKCWLIALAECSPGTQSLYWSMTRRSRLKPLLQRRGALPIRGNPWFWFEADPEPILRHLTQRHGDVVILSPWLIAEADPDWDGNYDFLDPERGLREAHRIEPATLRRYREAYQNHFALWKTAARRHHAAFARIPCADDLATVLFREAVPIRALETII